MTEEDKKIIDSLTHDDIVKISDAERKKAFYYFGKQAGDSKQRQKIINALIQEIRETGKKNATKGFLTYQGSRYLWSHLFTVQKNEKGGYINSEDDGGIYGEGNDKGYLTTMDIGEDTFNAFYTSEFFGKIKADFYKDSTDRVETIKRFLMDNVAYTAGRLIQSDGVDMVLIMLKDIVAYGLWKNGNLVIETYRTLSKAEEEFCTNDKKREIYNRLVESYKKSYKDAMFLDDEYEANEEFRYCCDLFDYAVKHIKNAVNVFKTRNAYTTMGEILCKLLKKCTKDKFMLPRINYRDADMDFLHHRIVDVIDYCPEATEENFVGIMRKRILKATREILEHNKFKVEDDIINSELEKIDEWMIFIQEESNNQKANQMDKRMREKLRSILKSYGLRDKYENLIKDTRTTVEAWYSWVESVYAISRLHPYITNEKDKPKFLSADKEWIAYIVNEEKSGLLDDYIKKYSKSVVIQAIHYLMDNGIWEAPLGVEGIRKASADLYKGIKAIDEAVACLKDRGVLVTEEEKPAEPEKPVENKDLIEFDDESVTGKRTDAQKAFSFCETSLKELSEHFSTLSKYFEQDELTDMLEKENTKLSKDNKRLEESIRVVNHQYGDAKKEIEKQKELAFNATKEKNTAIDNFNKLKKQYDEMKEDYDFLKREAKKATEVPVAKIIAYSQLRDLPLVGPTVLKSLIPFLRKHNIVVDEHK